MLPAKRQRLEQRAVALCTALQAAQQALEQAAGLPVTQLQTVRQSCSRCCQACARWQLYRRHVGSCSHPRIWRHHRLPAPAAVPTCVAAIWGWTAGRRQGRAAAASGVASAAEGAAGDNGWGGAWSRAEEGAGGSGSGVSSASRGGSSELAGLREAQEHQRPGCPKFGPPLPVHYVYYINIHIG